MVRRELYLVPIHAKGKEHGHDTRVAEQDVEAGVRELLDTVPYIVLDWRYPEEKLINEADWEGRSMNHPVINITFPSSELMPLSRLKSLTPCIVVGRTVGRYFEI
jgi:hypothetical protein